MKTCPNCGKEIEEDVPICAYCGASFEEKEEGAPVTEGPTTAEEPPAAEEPIAEEATPTEEPTVEEIPAAGPEKAEAKTPKISKFVVLGGAVITILGVVLIILQQLDAGIGAAAIGLITLVYGLVKRR